MDAEELKRLELRIQDFLGVKIESEYEDYDVDLWYYPCQLFV
jgi:hypothetical protein